MGLSPLEAFYLYRNSQQPVNTSNREPVKTYASTAPQQTAHQILNERDQKNVSSQQSTSNFNPPSARADITVKSSPYLSVGDTLPGYNKTEKQEKQPTVSDITVDDSGFTVTSYTNYRTGADGKILTDVERRKNTEMFKSSNLDLISGINEAKQTGAKSIQISYNAGGKERIVHVPISTVAKTRTDILRLTGELQKEGYTPSLSYAITKTRTETEATRSIQKLGILNYADRVDLGFEKKPEDIGGKAQYYFSSAIRPVYELAPAAINLIDAAHGKEPKQNYAPSATSNLIGGIGEGILYGLGFKDNQGKPLGKPIEQALAPIAEDFKNDPVKTLVQIPAEVGLFITGGEILKAGSIPLKAGGKIAGEAIAKTKVGQAVTKAIANRPISNIAQAKVLEVVDPVKESKTYGIEKLGKNQYLFSQGIEEAPSQIPFVKVGLKGKDSTVEYFRSAVQDSVIPKSFSVVGETQKGIVKNLGFKEIGKDIVQGEGKAGTVKAISDVTEKGFLQKSGEVIKYPLKQVQRDPEKYGSIAKNPEKYPGITTELVLGTERISPNASAKIAIEGENKLLGQDYFLERAGLNTAKKMRFTNPLSGEIFDTDIGMVKAATRPTKSFKKFDFTNDIRAGRVGAGSRGRSESLFQKSGDVLEKRAKTIGLQSLTRQKYDPLGTIATPTQKQMKKERVTYDDSSFTSIVYPKTSFAKEITSKNKTRYSLDYKIKSPTNQKIINTPLLDQLDRLVQPIGPKTKQKNDLVFETILNVTPKLKVKEKTSTLFDTAFIPITKQKTEQVTIPITKQVPIPKFPGGGLGGGFAFPVPLLSSGGYGKNQKRSAYSKTSFFTYSVNPNVVGVIAEAGKPGKIVSTKLGKLNDFGGSRIGKTRKRGKNNIDSFSEIGNFGKMKF